MVSRDTKKSAPSQACNAKTARSFLYEQVKHVGNSWGKALAHEKVKFHRYFAKILRGSAPKRAFSQPRERKASKDTTQRPPRPCATSPPPRARPSGGRPTTIPPQHGRTRASSKLPAGPQRRAAHHRQASSVRPRAACHAWHVELAELQAALASLLSQRPSHPTDRPAPARPPPPFVPLQAVARPQNGSHSMPRGCSAPRCWSCWHWTGASCCRTYRLAHCTLNCSCCANLLRLAVCRVAEQCCGCCTVQFWSARNAQNLNLGWSTGFCIQPFLWPPLAAFCCQLTRQR